MRTLELHAHSDQVQRSKGHSSVEAAAYRTASRLVDERTGEVYDYTNKKGVGHTQIYLPDNAPNWAKDREQLWNAVEAIENKSNAVVAREWVVGFPTEYSEAQRLESGDALARALRSRHGGAVEIAHHEPSKKGDQRNHHAHILYTARAFDENTETGWAKTKSRNFSKDVITVDSKKTSHISHELKTTRKIIADQLNHICQRDGLNVFVQHESFKDRGIKKEPTKHLGKKATHMERRGAQSEIGNINREIKASNDNHKALEAEKIHLTLEHDKKMQNLNKQITILAEDQNFPFHQKSVEDAKKALEKSQGVLHHSSIFDRITGKTRAYQEDLETKQRTLEAAQERFNTLKANEAQNRHIASTSHKTLAERKTEATQYTHEQKELSNLRTAFDSRTTAEKITGAVTGKTQEQQAKIEELREKAKTYEQARQKEETQTQQFNKEENQTVNDNQKEGLKGEFTQANDNISYLKHTKETKRLWEGYKEPEKSRSHERDKLER